ncbi:hypothetical protein EV426DRAFT_717700 [Tirmania nivea]|nr:hypothetical protein EV426DRAFT_717700 [Tirmania nivea]
MGGKKELKLGCVLDGQAIGSLYQARKEADLEKAAKKAAQEAAKHQRAQTSKLRKSAAKTSHQRHPTKRSQTKPQKAASPIDIPSGSSSYYEIENESDDCAESLILTMPAPPLPPIYLPLVPQSTLGHPASNASSLACLHRQAMRPISSSPIKGNTSSVAELLRRDTSTASTSSAMASSGAATSAPRGRGDILDAAAIEIPHVRGRSQSPVKDLRSQQPLNRNLFSKSPAPKSPSKGVINSDFTGRTFSERTRAVQLKVQGAAIPPLPSRTLDEVPWKKGRSRSREGSELDEVDINVRVGNGTASVKQTTIIQEHSTLVTKDKAPPTSTQLTMGLDSDSSTSSADTASIPRYEMIIWRTFPARKSHRDQKFPQQTRKCSFPITKKLAQRLVSGQKTDFITALNQFLSTQGTGVPITSDPSFTLQVTVQPDGTTFPPEFLDLAEQQFADIIDEIVSYQVQGYGRWSLDGMMRRVVTPQAGQLASLGPCLEALVVINLEACGNRWVGLPGFDADGNLKSISRSEISEAKKAVDASSPHRYLPLAIARFTSDSATTPDSKREFVTIPTPHISQHPSATDTRFPTAPAKTASKASKGVATTGLKPPQKIIATATITQRSSSPDFADGEEETGDEDMSLINIENVKVLLNNRKTSQFTPMASRTIGINQANACFGLPGAHLPTSTTPSLAPTPVRHHGVHASSFIASGTGIAATYASEAPVSTASKLRYLPRLGSSTTAPLGDNVSFSDPGAIPKPKPPTTQAQDIATRAEGDQKAKAQTTHRREVLVKGQHEVEKAYMSNWNPSNPLPGTPFGIGLLEQKPALHMVVPTPPTNISLPEAVTTDADTKSSKPQRRKVDNIGAGFARKTSGTLVASKSGTLASRLQVPADRALVTAKPQTKTLAHPTRSLQNLAQAAAGETAVFRRRWEESTAASLRKERPPSPVKSRANSPIKRADSPVKSSSALDQPTTTASNFTRTASVRGLGASGARPKSRLECTTGPAGNRTKERVQSGATTGVVRGNILSLRHEGKSS